MHDTPNMYDCRNVAANFNDPRAFDEKKMLLTIRIEDEDENHTEVSFPAKFDVCGVCSGKGSHVNPSIDDNGITAEDWDRDWSYEDREAYMSGAYDVQCYGCHGKRVIPVIDEMRLTKEQKAHLDEYHKQLQDEAEFQQLCAMERRMGC